MKMKEPFLFLVLLVVGCPALEGPPGYNSLLGVEEVPAGDVCPFGGRVITSGLDLDRDDQLSAEEVTSTDPLCNGSPGANGSHASYRVLSADRSVELGRSTGVGNWLWNEEVQGYVWLEVVDGRTRFGVPPGGTSFNTLGGCDWGSFGDPVVVSHPLTQGALIPAGAVIVGYGKNLDGSPAPLFYRSNGIEDLTGKFYDSFGKYPDYLVDRSLCTSKTGIDPIGPMPSPATAFYWDRDLDPAVIPVEYDGAPIFEPITLP